MKNSNCIYAIIDNIYLKVNRQILSWLYYFRVIEINTRIKDLRIDNDLTQSQVADTIGITQRKYSYLETEVQPLSDEIICKLAKFYNTSADYILRLTNEQQYPKK